MVYVVFYLAHYGVNDLIERKLSRFVISVGEERAEFIVLLSITRNFMFSILMSNENAPPFKCAKLWRIKSWAQMCYVCLSSSTRATILHKNFNLSDCANIRRNVSLQIALITVFVYT